MSHALRYGPLAMTVATLFLLGVFAPPPVDQDYAERAIDRLGSSIVSFFVVGGGTEDVTHHAASPGTALTGWAESSLTVERTGARHASRPASFGSHLAQEITLPLYPLTALNASDDQFGCSPSLTMTTTMTGSNKRGEWAALVQRGKCSFSQKARHAQSLGARVLVYGDESESEGGVPGGGLLTPWSPDDTSDIYIASSFVSRSSYLSLLATFEAEQKLPSSLAQSPPPAADSSDQVRGLMVTFSKDEIFAWPFLDLLLMLLFLPTLLTLMTVFTHRLRLARQRQAERAPREAIDGLRVFAWQVPPPEKRSSSSTAAATDETVNESDRRGGRGGGGARDEEAAIGETTPLLPPALLSSTAANGRPSPPLRRQWHMPDFFHRLPFVRRKRAKVLKAPDRHRAFVRTSECAICLSDFEKGELVMELPCGHWFHKEEVVPWLAEQRGVVSTALLCFDARARCGC